MSAYKVTAPLVVVPDQAGVVHHRYHGHVIPWLSDASREHLLGLGMVEEIASPVPPGVAEGDDTSTEPDGSTEPSGDAPKRPAQTAPKPAWVDYLVAVKGVDRAEAEALDKADLIALAD